MTPALHSIRTAALKLAEREWSPSYKLALNHVALDAQAAIDGCPASLASVTEFIEGDHELYCLADEEAALARPAHFGLAA